MRLPFELFISLRYLRAKRRQAFISLTTIISIIGVSLGVMALIVVLSVMSGFEQEIRNRILGVNAHVFVFNFKGSISNYHKIVDELKKVEGVTGVSPVIYTQVILNTGERVSGAVLRGIDVNTCTNLAGILRYGKLEELESVKEINGNYFPSIVIGKELAKNLGIWLGDTVSVISPFGRITPQGPAPKIKQFLVKGVFESGMYEYDTSLIYIPLKEAQTLLNLGRAVTGLEVMVNQIFKAKETAKKIQQDLGYPFWTRNWMEMNKSLFSALKLEKLAMFIMLSLIVLVAAAGIAGTLIMIVMEKNKDIAILKSMGATSANIMKIFVYEGLIIGSTGAILGLIGGITICLLLSHYQFIHLPKDIYYISTLPVEIRGWDIFFIVIAALTICFLATLYPSWKASRLDPVEAIRYE
ncbi:MAG: ABC transporter permease [Syntrophobacter sp. DG_60]|nr:MAG: ABC transporter permease [Syntrophobacter sp. DG_60]